MKTLHQKNDEEQRSSNSTTAPDRSPKKNNNKKTTNMVSFPTEILEDILSRLPVKSILRSRSVSKTWLNLISDPSFNKLQISRATTTHRRNGFFIIAYDHSTETRYYLTAAKEGGSLTQLMKIDDSNICTNTTGPSHLNGLMYFTSWTCKSFGPTNAHAFLVNPATRKVFQITDTNFCSNSPCRVDYLYGFDETRNEHKVLLIKKVKETNKFEFMIYSMSTYSWRKIDVEPPVVGFKWWCMFAGTGGGVCVNSVVYVTVILKGLSCDIVAFDFVTEKFSVIRIPQGLLPDDNEEEDEEGSIKVYAPAITKINGCFGVVLHDLKRSEVCICLLQDYQKRVWAKETIKFPKSWNDLVPVGSGETPPTVDVNMDDEIVFCLGKRTENVITIPVYNMKTKCFKSLQFTLEGQLASSKRVWFYHVSCYLETIMPLVDNWSKTSHGESD